MVISPIKSLFLKKKAPAFDESFAPSFKTLMHMKKDVPYLKDFNFKKTSNRSGDAKSVFKGRGIEFEEVRTYQFGDDLRDIDWRVTARKNQPYTKIYAEEKDREVYVVLDLSPQMYFATKGELKSVTASKTAALLGWLALSYHDKFGLIIDTGAKNYFFKAKYGDTHLLSVFKKTEQIARAQLNDNQQSKMPLQSLPLIEQKINRRSIVFVISSFDGQPQSAKKLLPIIRQNEVYLVDIFDPIEKNAPPSGVYTAVYGDFEATLDVSGKDFERVYQNYFEEKRRKMQTLCKKYGAHYRPVQTDLPIPGQLSPV